MFNPSPKIKLGKDVQIFIGINGSGKSSLIEAIALIFSEIKKYSIDGKSRERKFDFEIEYSFVINNITEQTSTTLNASTSIHHIVVTSLKHNGLEFTMLVDEQHINTWQQMNKFLPDNLIFYYAGFDDTLEKIVEIDEQYAAERLYDIKDQDVLTNLAEEFSKSFTYIRKQHFPLLFILNYIDNKMSLPLTGKNFTIYNITFQLKKPRNFSNDDFANFYNIQGFLRNYLQNLIQHSQPLEEIKDGKKHIGAKLTIEYHWGLLEAVDSLTEVPNIDRYVSTRYISFHLINLLLKIGILDKIDVLIRDTEGNIYSITDLSEGEQQLVIIETINKILCRENTILFFDEPDAFLHPQRQREIIPHLINQFSSRFLNQYTQLILTTHSPFLAQSVDLKNILHFNKNGKVNTFQNNLLSYVTITEDLFGIKSEFKKEIETNLLKFQARVKDILLSKKEVDDWFIALKDKLITYGEGVEVVVNYEIRKLIKEGKYNAENA